MTHNLLKGKRGIIFGALNEDSIAWKVAEKAAAEGAQITLSNTQLTLRIQTTLLTCSKRAWRCLVVKSISCSTLLV